MTRSTLALFCCALGLAAAPVSANEAERLANLSKSDFLATYEARYIASLEVSDMLIRRFDPAYADLFDSDTPVTEAERESFACVYDAMAAQGALIDLARHSLSTDALVEKIEADPDFDYVDMMDPAMMDAVDSMTPSDSIIAAMSDCGAMTLSAERMSLTDAFWADMQAAAMERGYLEAN